MAWRNVIISNPSKLSIKNNQLKIEQSEQYFIPLEDIATIMIESQQTILTSRLLSELSQKDIVLYVCDEKHLPVGVLSSYYQHSRQLKILDLQINSSIPFKKRLWQSIIKEKINNQAKVLEIIDKNNKLSTLKYFSKTVESGDKSFCEGKAAKIYFKELFGKDFIRHFEDTINSALNYGYAIVRGAIARYVAIYGFIPALGVGHHSQLNAFNLIDDLIEPYRPLVDLWVYKNVNINEEFDRTTKHGLFSLLYHNIMIDNKKQSLINSIDVMVKSLHKAYSNNNHTYLLLPKIYGLEHHQYE